MSGYGTFDQPIDDYVIAPCPFCESRESLVHHVLDNFLEPFVRDQMFATEEARTRAAGQVVVTCTSCGFVGRALRHPRVTS